MTARREFLGWLGATSVLTTVLSPADAGAEAAPTSKTTFRGAFDMTWFDRLQGKKVAVFDSPELAEGSALFRASFWRKQNEEVFGTPIAAMVPVLVLRHKAIPLAMDDTYWAKYEIGKETKTKDFATKKWAEKNPIGAADAHAPPDFADVNLERFINTGGIVLACNLAFQECVDRVKKADKLNDDDAYAKAKTMLWPGVILQPSGFFAVLKAQETGGGYIFAS